MVRKIVKKNDQDYKDGLEDGKMLIWQFIGKLGRLTIGEIYEIFASEYDNFYKIAYDYSPSEFIDKIKTYEKQQKCKECKWNEYKNGYHPNGNPCDSCIDGKNFSSKAPNVARCCSVLDDVCPYDIPCAECEVHCSVERAKQKLKGDKE